MLRAECPGPRLLASARDLPRLPRPQPWPGRAQPGKGRGSIVYKRLALLNEIAVLVILAEEIALHLRRNLCVGWAVQLSDPTPDRLGHSAVLRRRDLNLGRPRLRRSFFAFATGEHHEGGRENHQNDVVTAECLNCGSLTRTRTRTGSDLLRRIVRSVNMDSVLVRINMHSKLWAIILHPKLRAEKSNAENIAKSWQPVCS